MIFSSLLFLYAFLPLFLVAYYLAPSAGRNSVALVASLIFYVWGEPVFALWLVASSLVDYVISLRLARLPATATAAGKGLVALSLTMNLGALACCKYANFFVEQLNGMLGWVHHGNVAWTKIALPIGISFFTFHKVSYLVDVYRGVTRPAKSTANFLLYVMFFPQLIAGPIIRYRDIAAQIDGREHTLDRFLSGVWRFLLGLGRKTLVADQLGLAADKVFGQEIASLPMPYAWVGLLCYAFQIYFDFSGYSDMAIGLARMTGFEFLENFNRPYMARGITEFWRRWHISLSNFMRDYLYIPLGGNRVAPWRMKLNLWLVFLASGFWHGASWSFIVWGAFHGSLLSLEKGLGPRRVERVPAWLAVPVTFLLVLASWVFFRVTTLPDALAFFGRLTDCSSWHAPETRLDLPWPDVIGRRTVVMFAIAMVSSFLPDSFWRRWGWDDALPASTRSALARIALGGAVLLLASATLANQSYHPFIYFRF
ncbi:MAG: MBOAT family protein [Opitutaceae bacterium]|nr:MBOAT family protein [Opitutaceae bacterium]